MALLTSWSGLKHHLEREPRPPAPACAQIPQGCLRSGHLHSPRRPCLSFLWVGALPCPCLQPGFPGLVPLGSRRPSPVLVPPAEWQEERPAAASPPAGPRMCPAMGTSQVSTQGTSPGLLPGAPGLGRMWVLG